MPRTSVAAPGRRPEKIGITGHARAIPQGLTFTTFPVTLTWHFFERAEHSVPLRREESI